MVKYFVFGLSALCLTATAYAQTGAVLLDDDFSGLPPRMFSSGVVGAQAEYHFLPGWSE